MDPINDVLTAIRVESVCYGRLLATAPWGLRFEAAQHAKFSLVSQGSGWLKVEGIAEPIPLAAGDFFLLAPGREFTLSHDTAANVYDFDDALRDKLCNSIPIGGGGAPTTMICGQFAFDDTHARSLADLLPPMIHIPAHETRTSALQKTLDLLAEETSTPTPGSQLVMNRLADVLFIQAVRVHIASSKHVKTAWISALSDQHIGASLRSMHETLERSWTVASLASSAGMSRSAFAQRFKELVGEAPREYLTRWRMYRASQLLRESRSKLVDVAQAVGYDSEGAFSRAFRRVIGVAPGEYRRNRNQKVVGITPARSLEAATS